jgi:membrane protease YdiL (CAAX protease family)
VDSGDPAEPRVPLARAVVWALGGGLLLGIFGWVYQALMPMLPGVGEQFVKTVELFHTHPAERWWLFGLAVLFAPVAEEYLFRGLLYRALDREWGGWQAMGASALFFAIYHPPMSWLPVGALGLFNALLFKRTGRLLPCVLVHGIYNAIVVLAL